MALRLFLAAVFFFLHAAAYADEPPSWSGFTVDSDNGLYRATVSGSRADGYVLDVYDVYVGWPDAPLWSTPYSYDGYPGGILSDDGGAFAYVSFWYCDDGPVVYIYRSGGPAVTVRGSELEFDRTKIIKSVSHRVWLSGESPACRFVESRDGGLFLEINTVDGGRHMISVREARGPAVEPSELKLSIKPGKRSYGLDEAVGGVTITARFENAGDSPVFLAHPSATVPDGYTGEGSFGVERRYGSSEILLYITGPGGEETVLRHGMFRGFEPGNRFRLDIPPGGFEEVRLGWLGPYFALGMWDDIREPIFTERGEYRLRLVYRNHFTKALSFGTPGKAFADYIPWTGETASNIVSIQVD